MRTVMRFVNHRIIPLARKRPVVSAKCLYEGCGWTAETSDDLAVVDRQGMSHTGLSPHHAMFGRTFEDVAIVQRVSQWPTTTGRSSPASPDY
ncbi:hypothetical protein GCM10010425_54700 [Streptomyces spororaveus]|uniref:DUF7848 domain-containing protein n=1 Tax=Streptomyces spororaveus TaxID=284039 RepID=A0ABQ3TAC7_9ACTN|nr:hypothetical protein Sspor_28930 [Streptomyces spororaveus]